MKARAFDYTRASSLESAMAAYRDCAGEARYIAGGQSLLAALNLRLDAPDLLIDIAHIEALRGVDCSEGTLRIGALTRHAEILTSPLIARHVPLLAAAAAYVAHPAIRNKGTFGGSLALADPASEFPTVARALDAEIEITDADGIRRVAAADFFLGLYETALMPGEILSAVRFPLFQPEDRCYFHELARRRGDYAIVGLAAQARFDGPRVATMRLAFCSVSATPVRASETENRLAGQILDADTILAAQAGLGDDLEPDDDVQVAGTTRLHLAKVLLGRALATLASSPAAAAAA